MIHNNELRYETYEFNANDGYPSAVVKVKKDDLYDLCQALYKFFHKTPDSLYLVDSNHSRYNKEDLFRFLQDNSAIKRVNFAVIHSDNHLFDVLSKSQLESITLQGYKYEVADAIEGSLDSLCNNTHLIEFN